MDQDIFKVNTAGSYPLIVGRDPSISLHQVASRPRCISTCPTQTSQLQDLAPARQQQSDSKFSQIVLSHMSHESTRTRQTSMHVVPTLLQNGATIIVIMNRLVRDKQLWPWCLHCYKTVTVIVILVTVIVILTLLVSCFLSISCYFNE